MYKVISARSAPIDIKSSRQVLLRFVGSHLDTFCSDEWILCYVVVGHLCVSLFDNEVIEPFLKIAHRWRRKDRIHLFCSHDDSSLRWLLPRLYSGLVMLVVRRSATGTTVVELGVMDVAPGLDRQDGRR